MKQQSYKYNRRHVVHDYRNSNIERFLRANEKIYWKKINLYAGDVNAQWTCLHQQITSLLETLPHETIYLSQTDNSWMTPLMRAHGLWTIYKYFSGKANKADLAKLINEFNSPLALADRIEVAIDAPSKKKIIFK